MASRGKNFTEREKYKLLELVQRYKNVIENKSTNAVSTATKNEAWEAITQGFNINAEVPRNKKQLFTAYMNSKRITRQNVASKNIRIDEYLLALKVQKYLHNIKNDHSHSEAGTSQVVTSIEESNMQNDVKYEMVNEQSTMATDGGEYNPVFSTVGEQISSVMGDQVTPLSNSCDSASSYYENDEDVNPYEVVSVKLDVTDALSSSVTQDTSNVPQDESEKIEIQRKTSKKKIVPENNNFLKRKFYETKLECVNLEKRNRLLEYRLNLKRDKLLDLEIKIKQKEYENMVQK